MRPAWRLAISSVSERPSRSFLLIAVVAMAAMLIAAVGVALSSLRGAIEGRVESVIGKADLRIKPIGRGGMLDASLVDLARAWPESRIVVGRIDAPLALRFGRLVWRKEIDTEGHVVWRRKTDTYAVSAIGVGIEPKLEKLVRPVTLLDGRMPEAEDEIVLDKELARRLGERHNSPLNLGAAMSFLQKTTAAPTKADAGPEFAANEEEAKRLTTASAIGVGDRVQLLRFQKPPMEARVVGIAAQPPLGGNPQGYMSLQGLSKVSSQEGRLSQIDIISAAPANRLEEVVERRKSELPNDVLLQTTEKVTSGLNRNLQTNQFGFIIVSTLAFLAASFIIMTGMSTGVTERQRELGILRCIGATRRQLAATQLLQGLILGSIGSAVGVPLGVAGASFMVRYFHDRIQADVDIDAWRLVFAFLGATVASVVGAVIPAFQASRVSPLQALASRAVVPKRRTITIITLVGLVGVLVHLAVFTLIRDGNVVFYSYLAAGLPGLLGGYFLLGVPTLLLVVLGIGPLVERLLGLPRHLLTRGIRATPYRFGFTSGAMMAGLGLMVAIWTQGGAAVRDWLDKIEFPDAFVVGLSLSPESQKKLEEMPFVKATSSVAMQTVETDAFGLRGMMKIKTYFLAFEPRSFFKMNRLEWIQGDPETAAARIEQGGAVIVAREYLTAQGLGVGSVFRCRDSNGKEHTFDIVGVVTSPGLEIISDFFDVGVEFQDQRMHAVFGGRKDLAEHFGNRTVGMIQIDLADDVDDETALQAMREQLIGSGVLNAGSGRQIKQDILRFVKSTVLVSSVVALFSMFVACFGVANLIVAGIQARQFEFGVLRSVGAPGGLLTRLVLGEAIIIAIAACILGTVMGVQGAFGAARLNELLWGVALSPRPPIAPVAAGWGFVLVMCISAALPAVLGLARKRPRELLGAIRG